MEFWQKYISFYFMFIFLPQVHLQKSDSDGQILSLLNEQFFTGIWQSNTQQFYQFNYLDQQSGKIQVRFENDNLQLLALNPKYYEEKHVVAEFKVSNYSESLQAFIGKTQLYLEGGVSNYQPWIESFCWGTYKIKLNQKLENLDINKLEIDVDLQSYSDTYYHCLINMSFHVTRDQNFNFYNNLIFSLIATILQVVQFYSTIKLSIQIKLQERYQEQLSILALLLQFSISIHVFMHFICIISLNQKYFYFYIVPSFIQILSYSFILILIEKIALKRYKLKQVFAQMSTLKKLLKDFLIFTALGLINGMNIVLCIIFIDQFYFMLFYAVALYPQIIHNIRLGIKYKFNKLYIFGLLSSHIFYYFYLRSCSNNVMGLKPDYLFVGIYLTIYILSLILIMLQVKYGSRCFIPKFLQPKLFLQKVKVNTSMECAICLNYLYLNSIDINDQSLDKSLICQIVVTPCLHQFHSQCLEKWMEVQVNCPLCRSDISLMKQNNN